MKICIGATRVVVLYAGNAYKFARIRPLKLCLKIVQISLSQASCLKMFEKYGTTDLYAALCRYLFAGFYANKIEKAYSTSTVDERVNPVARCVLQGICVLQPATTSVSDSYLKKQKTAPATLFGTPDSELGSSRQFGLDPAGRVVIVDYGSPLTIRILTR